MTDGTTDWLKTFVQLFFLITSSLHFLLLLDIQFFSDHSINALTISIDVILFFPHGRNNTSRRSCWEPSKERAKCLPLAHLINTKESHGLSRWELIRLKKWELWRLIPFASFIWPDINQISLTHSNTLRSYSKQGIPYFEKSGEKAQDDKSKQSIALTLTDVLMKSLQIYVDFSNFLWRCGICCRFRQRY